MFYHRKVRIPTVEEEREVHPGTDQKNEAGVEASQDHLKITDQGTL